MKNKHAKEVLDLEKRLKSKPYCEDIWTFQEYSLGECDVIRRTKHKMIYYEVKAKHTKRGFKTAKGQLFRWSKYMSMHKNHINYYGIYYTRQTGAKLICKNGVAR